MESGVRAKGGVQKSRARGHVERLQGGESGRLAGALTQPALVKQSMESGGVLRRVLTS